MRLDKLLAHMGFGTRKDVRTMIKKGHVKVNDLVIKDKGLHVDPNQDLIVVGNEPVYYQKYIYLMLNKPSGYISATEDEFEKTVIDLLPDTYRVFKPFPVGRLDKDTEGLLLLTNDGKLAHRLTTPKNNIGKTYYAKVKGLVTEGDIYRFKTGITLNDGYLTKPARLSIIKSGEISEIHLTLTEGKFHQVKRMFASLDKKVIYLKRIQMGHLPLDPSLSLGEFRELTADEIQILNQ